MTALGLALIALGLCWIALNVRADFYRWLAAHDARIRREERRHAERAILDACSEARLDVVRTMFPDTFGDVRSWEDARKRAIALQFAAPYFEDEDRRPKA